MAATSTTKGALGSERARRSSARRGVSPAVLAGIPGICALLWEPLLWTWRTWWDASWDSAGWAAAAAVVALVLASVTSGRAAPDAVASARDRRLALALLGATTAVRLVGRVLAVHVIGAAAVALDVVALGLALGLARRPFALSPLGLGALAGFALPVGQVLQRLVGQPLRLAAAAVAEALVSPFSPSAHREGGHIVDDHARVFVDLPCSGANGLALLAALVAFFLTVLAFSRPRAFVLVLVGVAAAVAGNGLRIALLFAGARAGIDVWSEPLHSGVGVIALALACAPLVVVAAGAARRAPPREAPGDAPRDAPRGSTATAPTTAKPPRRARPTVAAAVFSAVAVVVVSLPGHPIDVQRAPLAERHLPAAAAGFQSTAVPLSALEERYFATWGGAAEKRRYVRDEGAVVVDVVFVRTSSPLRHLHGPERCLAGAGQHVVRTGVAVDDDGAPSAMYRATDPRSGVVRDVAATFVRDDGVFAESDAEAAWSWLRDPRHTWMLLERLRVSGATPTPVLDRALLAAIARDT